jgi:ATP phosphoribosyltransferase
VAVEEIMSISSRLVVNQAALKLKHDAIQPIIEAFRGAVGLELRSGKPR